MLRLAHRGMESLEYAARILLAVETIGRATPLSATDGIALQDARNGARAGWNALAYRIEDGGDQ